METATRHTWLARRAERLSPAINHHPAVTRDATATVLTRITRSRSTRYIAAIAIAWFIGLTCTTPTQASTQRPNDLTTAEGIRAELERLGNAARVWQPRPYTEFTIEEVGDYIPDAATLDAWRQEVAGKPSHPQRTMLNVYERRISQGPEIGRIRFLWVSDTAWRNTTDRPHHGDLSEYGDTAENQRDAWQLSPTRLVINTDKNDSDVINVFRNNRDSTLRDLGILFTLGATEIPVTGGPWSEPKVTLTGNRWSATWDINRETERWERVATGRIVDQRQIGASNDASSLLIDSIRTTVTRGNRVEQEHLQLEDIRWHPLADGPVAERFRWKHRSEAHTHRLLIEARPVEKQKAELLVRTPTLSGGDAIRSLDRLQHLQLHDNSGLAVNEIVQTESESPTLGQVLAQTNTSASRKSQQSQTMRWLSISLAVVIAGALVIKRVWFPVRSDC